MAKIRREFLDHPVAMVSGVTENDTRIEAAEKAIATAKMAGFPRSTIRRMENMLADAKARGVR